MHNGTVEYPPVLIKISNFFLYKKNILLKNENMKERILIGIKTNLDNTLGVFITLNLYFSLLINFSPL